MPTINLETDVYNEFETLEVVEPPYFPAFTGEETLTAYAECWSEDKQLWYWTEIQSFVDSRAYHKILVDGKEWWGAWAVIKALGLPEGRYTQQDLRTALTGLLN